MAKTAPTLSPVEIERLAVPAVVKALGGSMRDGYVVHHVECGLHSGFPPCCIAFGWIYSSLLVRATVDMSYEEMDAVRAPYHKLRGNPGVGYYACPACLLLRNIVTVRKCACQDELNAFIRAEMEKTAKRKRKPAGWVSACLVWLNEEETPNPDTDAEDAFDRGHAAWHRTVIARNRAR